MAPRASGKKEPATLWYLCEQCQVNITSKDRDQHGQHCPIRPADSAESTDATDSAESSAIALPRPFAVSYVHSRRLYTTSVSDKLPSDSLITNLPAAQLNGFVFVSESTMSVCGWILGDLVTLRTPQLVADRVPPVVVAVWPVPDRFGATVFISREELQSTWRGLTDFQLIIAKYDRLAAPAATISLQLATSTTPSDASSSPQQQRPLSAQQWRDLRKVVAQQFYNRLATVGTRLSLEFFNKTFTFDVVSCIAAAETESSASASADVADHLASLSLAETPTEPEPAFFTITQRTEFQLDTRNEAERAESTGAAPTTASLSQVGGLTAIIRQLRDIAALAFGQHASLRGIQIARSVLIHGLPGCGKSLLCEALAADTGAAVIRLQASELFSKYYGETEANLRQHFDRAYALFPRPTVLIVEEIVNVCAKEAKEDSGKRVCAAFLNALDAVHSRREAGRLLVLATTSVLENIAPAARRCGRLDVEIEIPAPAPEARAEILQCHVSRVANDLRPEEVRELAQQCHGFVGADLASLVAKAALHATKVAAERGAEAAELRLQLADVQQVFALVKPSAMREVLIECPNVRWSDIGGQEELKLQLKQAIEWPLTNPERFVRMGIAPPRGILMFGPPGCSKTMIAKALATESKVNFLSIKGPELFSMWVGESEKAVRDLFRKARSVAPAIIFFDEIDAIGGERAAGGGGAGGGAGGGSGSVKERVLAQMLTEMDGVHALQNVTIVAATNRPDLIDSALMRPGRIDRIVYVRLPDARTREEIFRIKLRKMPVAGDVDVAELVRRTDGYSGAEVQAVCQEAALKALEEDFETEWVAEKDFAKALAMVQRRTSKELLQLYEDYLRNF